MYRLMLGDLRCMWTWPIHRHLPCYFLCVCVCVLSTTFTYTRMVYTREYICVFNGNVSHQKLLLSKRMNGTDSQQQLVRPLNVLQDKYGNENVCTEEDPHDICTLYYQWSRVYISLRSNTQTCKRYKHYHYTVASVANQLTVLFEKLAASLLPSLFQHTSKIPLDPLYCLTIEPSLVDHMNIHLSKDPLARYFPSGLNDTEYTGSACFLSVWRQAPFSTSQRRMVESNEALEKHNTISVNTQYECNYGNFRGRNLSQISCSPPIRGSFLPQKFPLYGIRM